MTLTVADIGRWDAGDVREVFHAASSRAQAAHDAADGIATLPALASWGGVAAAAAKVAIGKTRRDLDAHGREALVVANAARSAAEAIERIQSELATVRGDAAALGMEVDAASGRVVAGPDFKGTAMELLLKQEQVQKRVDTLVVQANLVDLALANAIRMADGTTAIADAAHAAVPPLLDAVDVPAGASDEAAPKTWKDLVLPAAATEPEPSLPDSLNPQQPTNPGDPNYTHSPLSAPIIAAEPSAGEQQLARVNAARAKLDAAQSKLNAAASKTYTAGAGAGPGREATDALSQEVFDARRDLTAQTAILDDLNGARIDAGGRPVGIPTLPDSVGVQAFPPTPSVFAEGSRALSEGSFGLVPDVAKDIDVFSNWGQHSGADQAGAVLDVASSVPIPGAKFLGPALHGMGDLLGIADHVPTGIVDDLASGGAHAHVPGDHPPPVAGDHPAIHVDGDAGHVVPYSIEDTAALLTASEANGGHLIDKHVGKTLDYLAERLETYPWMKNVSSFASADEAAMAAQTALQHNQDLVGNWVANGATEKLKLEAPFIGGAVLRRGAADVVTGSSVRLMLKGDGTGGWYVLTGFLEP